MLESQSLPFLRGLSMLLHGIYLYRKHDIQFVRTLKLPILQEQTIKKDFEILRPRLNSIKRLEVLHP